MGKGWGRQVTGISIYTNRSKLNNRVVGGIFSAKLYITKIVFRLPGHCSAEITVIKESLLVLTNGVFTTRNIFIYLQIAKWLHDKPKMCFRTQRYSLQLWSRWTRERRHPLVQQVGKRGMNRIRASYTDY